jgi:hypothetical protein
VYLADYDRVVETLAPNGANKSVKMPVQQLTTDPGWAPQPIGQDHLADQTANLPRHLGASALRSRPPAPVDPKAVPMPSDQGLRRHDRHRATALSTDGKRRQRQTNRSGAQLVSGGRPFTFRRSTLNWWRRTRISAPSSERNLRDRSAAARQFFIVANMRRGRHTIRVRPTILASGGVSSRHTRQTPSRLWSVRLHWFAPQRDADRSISYRAGAAPQSTHGYPALERRRRFLDRFQ